MLFFELLPMVFMIVCGAAGIVLLMLDRQARQQPATEKSGEWRRPRPRS
jgi:hypothetical protein